jgi:hypothetical protein
VPARLRDIERAAKLSGLEIVPPNGPHPWKARRASDGKTYGIPAHNGAKTEISDVYVRAFCRTFGLDYAEFRKML